MTYSDATVLSAFCVDHVAQITGLSKNRLSRWDRLGFFPPEYIGDDNRRNPYARLYSFVDLVGLRTLKILADVHKVPLKELRKAADELKKRSDRPWSAIPLAVLKRKVVFDLHLNPRNVTDGQYALKHIPLQPIAQEVTERANTLRYRDDSQVGRTEKRKFIQHNAEVLSGTRIPVDAVSSFISSGYSNDHILKEFPTLTPRDISFVRKQIRSAA